MHSPHCHTFAIRVTVNVIAFYEKKIIFNDVFYFDKKDNTNFISWITFHLQVRRINCKIKVFCKCVIHYCKCMIHYNLG